MIYKEIINDKRFNYLVDKYLKNENREMGVIEYFNHFIKNMENNQVIMPVLGVQGAGKSSFLNAVLRNDNILPSDVDETTCVPVEIKYGNNTDAIIFFHDKPEKIINISELEKYVHNDYNEANKLNVKKIIIYSQCEILKNGIVLVDLPGVGSLTPENQQTTLDYVNKLVCGIFIIRTNPPITRTEKNFISALWSKLSNTIFVQNKWNDETAEDAEDAKEHNESVLETISIEHNDKKTLKVNIVNVYKALKGSLENSLQEYADSGIQNVINEIVKVSENYSDNLENNLKTKLNECFKNLHDQIVTFSTVAERESYENEAEKGKKIDELKTIISHNKKRFRSIRNNAEESLEKLINEGSDLIDEKIEKLTYDIKGIVDKGIVDGKKLSVIYKELSDKAINDIMDEILKSVSSLIDSLNEELGTITIKNFNGTYENISFFNKESEVKYENTLPSILGLSGGIIGTITAASVLGGPIGILTGMGIGIVFSLIGDYMKHEILKTRAELTMQDLKPMIEDLRNYLKEEILDDLRAKQLEVDESMKTMRKNIEDSFKDDIKSIEKQYDSQYTEEHIESFKKDFDLLMSIQRDYGINYA